MNIINLIYKTLRKCGNILSGGVIRCVPSGC